SRLLSWRTLHRHVRNGNRSRYYGDAGATSVSCMPSPSLRLEPLPGYAPTIGRLVGILLYARHTTLAAVEGLSIAELDHLQDASSNSIGALLAHIAAVERGYQCLTFEERPPSALE